MEKYLKNIDYSKALDFANLVNYGEGQVISRTLVQNGKVSMTLFAFDSGEEISSHASKGDAFVYILEGSANITIGDEKHIVEGGQVIVMPSNIPHALYAENKFKMLLVVVFPVK